MREKSELQALRKRHGKLLTQLSATGLVLQGTITERTITKKKSEGRGEVRTLGPYYQWTFKREGKTVTVNLSKAQTRRFQKAINENTKVEGILKQLRGVSRDILEVSTKGVERRK